MVKRFEDQRAVTDPQRSGRLKGVCTKQTWKSWRKSMELPPEDDHWNLEFLENFKKNTKSSKFYSTIPISAYSMPFDYENLLKMNQPITTLIMFDEARFYVNVFGWKENRIIVNQRKLINLGLEIKLSSHTFLKMVMEILWQERGTYYMYIA